MEPDLSRLDAFLDEQGVNGYLIDAASDVADQYYLSGFDAPDPFVTLYDGQAHLLVARSLEYGRAKREARAATVERDVDFGYDLGRERNPARLDHRAVEAIGFTLREYLFDSGTIGGRAYLRMLNVVCEVACRHRAHPHQPG